MTEAVHTTWNSCFCGCHSVIPVFITDRVAAATACSECKDDHVYPYRKKTQAVRVAADWIDPPRPADATGTTEEDGN